MTHLRSFTYYCTFICSLALITFICLLTRLLALTVSLIAQATPSVRIQSHRCVLSHHTLYPIAYTMTSQPESHLIITGVCSHYALPSLFGTTICLDIHLIISTNLFYLLCCPLCYCSTVVSVYGGTLSDHGVCQRSPGAPVHLGERDQQQSHSKNAVMREVRRRNREG